MINYSDEVIKLLKQCEIEAKKLNHNYIGSEHLLLSLLHNDNIIKNILNKNNIFYDSIYKQIKKIKVKSYNNEMIYTPLLKKILIYSSDNGIVNVKNLFETLIEIGEGIAFSLLTNLNINIKNIYKEVNNSNELLYGVNLNKEINKNNLFYGREKEINEIIEVLCRKNKNNPILIGNAGVGKTAIIEELANKINKGDVPYLLKDKQIISINISELLSGTKYRGEFEEKLNKLIKYFESNDKYILFIDEIHTIINAGGAEGAINASNILKPYLARNKIKCIGATTTQEYNNLFLNDKALNRRFYPINIEEANEIETFNILKHIKKSFEEFHNVTISNNQLKLIINISKKVLKDRYNPDKSIDLLDKICTKAKLQKNNHNLTKDILLSKKEFFLKNKDFLNAKKINNEINKITNKITITNDFIINNIDTQTFEYIGFKDL